MFFDMFTIPIYFYSNLYNYHATLKLIMIRYLIKMSRGFRWRITLSALCGIIRVLTGLGFVALSKRAVDLATGAAEGNLLICVTGLIGAIAIELVCSAVGNRTTDLAESEMRNKIQRRLFRHSLNAEWNGMETYHSGDVLSRITEDSRVAAECLCRTVPTIIIALVQFVGAFIFLCYFSPWLAIALTAILPIFMIAGKVFFRKTKVLTDKIRDIESRLQESMQESLHHRILLITCNYTKRTIENITALLQNRYDFIRKRSNLTVFSRTAVIAGFQSGYLAAFLWGIAGLRNGTITFGMMTAYLQLAGQIQRPMAELARLFPGLIQSHTAFSRLEEIEKVPSEDESTVEETNNNYLPLGIELSNVSFSYRDKGGLIFEKFNYTFQPGSKTAIVGETGAGKSTLLRLILGLLPPIEGDVRLFRLEESKKIDYDVSSITRKDIVYVPQGNSLLSGTIRSNLQIGKYDATDEEMKEALHAAAADFVFDLDLGLDTPCGEHGDGLSEGQAQRIAIARGLLRAGSILLLDEISASLDEPTETLLMQRLSARQSSHTILMITHRPSILPYCDSVLKI